MIIRDVPPVETSLVNNLSYNDCVKNNNNYYNLQLSQTFTNPKLVLNRLQILNSSTIHFL